MKRAIPTNKTTRESAFQALRSEFKAKARIEFLKDIEGQIEEDGAVSGPLDRRAANIKYFMITFDRRPNDASFSYTYFDFLLVILDRVSGGNGIYKPVNQVRAIRWNSTRSSLLMIIRNFGRLNANVRARRLLVLPFPLPAIGWRIDPKIHKK